MTVDLQLRFGQSGPLAQSNLVIGLVGDVNGLSDANQVNAIHETSGPTQLALGAIPDGTYLGRVGATVVGVAAPPPSGAAGGQLGGTYPNPDVRGLRETSGPTLLTLGAVADGTYLGRVGATVVGVAAPPPSGAAGGQLGGTYPNPDVRGLRETSGPTLLTLGAVADGQFLQRSGGNVVGAAAPAAVFGEGYQIDGPGSGTSTSAVWVSVAALTFSVPAAQTYVMRAAVRFVFDGVSNDEGEFRIRNVTDGTDAFPPTRIADANSFSDRFTMSAVVRLTGAIGSKLYQLECRRDAGAGTFAFDNAFLETWRVL